MRRVVCASFETSRCRKYHPSTANPSLVTRVDCHNIVIVPASIVISISDRKKEYQQKKNNKNIHQQEESEQSANESNDDDSSINNNKNNKEEEKDKFIIEQNHPFCIMNYSKKFNRSGIHHVH
mmetsp:Transcript_66399/g.74382  ORF Transcript_66399/g.74382 Transcript_66399/m.74382 type:complete len:123 (+) Transcript_66399:126-494(+)